MNAPTRLHKLDNIKLQDKVIKAREDGLTYKMCASVAGIDLKTLEAYRKDNEEFEGRLQTAKGAGVQSALRELRELARTSNSPNARVRAYELWLNSVAPELAKQPEDVNQITFNALIVNESDVAQKRIVDAITADKRD